jgi:uncharacterized protein YlaI
MSKCPICKDNELDDIIVHNALSKQDNKTYICSECSQAEAMEDFYKYGVGR